MSLAATDWVWTRSRARGAARLVLLAVADRAGADGVAYAGTAALMQRTRAARSTVRHAVDALLASGELAVVEGRIGPGGETVYRLPLLDERGAEDRPGPDFDPGRESAPGGPVSGPGEGRTSAPGGPATGPGEGRRSAPGGPPTGPQNVLPTYSPQEQQPRASSAALIPELRPLDDALAAALITVRWSLGLGEQRDVYRLTQQHGVEALVDLAARRTVPGEAPKAARYWLKVWSDLDRPAPSAPRRAPSSTAAYADNLAAGLALLAQKESHS
ncbi:hypothetical protein [Streptomyces xanthochromogenes]|uniref:Helix-turn-helix domain-containing protein n=1 Tax=Streptomyces xanthochromogenes TaxID=67384 RepID=A0ABQ2ZZJ9_9ACTN|nr:hypothetical protein [Streptomyces xanthochromogenes]GGY28101.1 hypothetical protein GCM10010326_22100 [Streptomyces xanthochromogenes]